MIKRGELTTEQLITLILAIAGFVIVLVVFGLLFGDDSDLADTELCRLAVLSRATAPDLVSASLPLKCTTSKVCITKGEECKQFAGEKGVIDVKLEGDFMKDKDRIEEILANGLYDCWNMMGRGHLDLFAKAPESLVGSSGNPTCVVCRRVAFADDVFESEPDLKDAINVDRYMERNNVPGTEVSYLSAMSDGGENTFSKNRVDEIKTNLNDPKIESGKSFTFTSNDQTAFVFSQVKPTKFGEAASNFALLGTGTVLIPGAARAAAKFPLIGALVLIGGAGVVEANSYFGRITAAGYCGDFTTSVEDKDLKKGCSLVQAVPYNVQDINNLCPGSIQGSP